MINHFKKKQKRSIKSTLLFALGGLLIVVVFLGLVVADLRIYQKKKRLSAHLENLEQKVKQAQAKNNNLKEGISESDNPEYIEKVAREELGLRQPGETVVSFIEPAPQEMPKESAPKNVWQKMIGALTGLLK